jgi:ribonuclease D
VEYAHADVEHLVQLAKKLMEELDRRGRKSWALELSAKWEDPQLYDPDPDSLTERLSKNGKLDARAFSALKELMRWREGRCREINVPRRWVADDSTLLDLAQVRPKDIEHLSAFRGLNKGELKHSGAQILEALKRAAESPQVPPPRGPRPDIPTPDELQALELLKCFIGILADQKQIALKHLVTSPQLLALLRCMDAVSVEDLASRGVLSQGAAQLIGVEVLAFLRGERALSLEILQKGCRVRIVS